MPMPTYICLEGIDGAGKSLQISILADYLTARDITPVYLHEPSYGPLGREIRRRAADDTIGDLDAQAALFTADRRDHVNRKITPLLAFVRSNPGFVILQNRSYVSAAAYQAPAEDETTLDAIIAAQEAFAPAPELILILDLPVETAIKRMELRGRRSIFETSDNLNRVRQRYTKIARIRPLCILVDASGGRELVASRIRDAIAEHGGRVT